MAINFTILEVFHFRSLIICVTDFGSFWTNPMLLHWLKQETTELLKRCLNNSNVLLHVHV